MSNLYQIVLLYLTMAIGLAGCGLRGDLYLPEEKTGNTGQPAPTEALESPEGVEDAQGFSAAPTDDEADDESDDEKPEIIYPDTGMPVTP